MTSLKQEALDLINHMPEEFSWDDLMYEINLKRKVHMALLSYEEGRISSHNEIKKKFIK